MSAEYSRDHCKLAVGKILQTIGWHSINSTPLEVLTDLLTKYIRQISRITNDYANEFGQTEPNLDHLGLAFQEVGVNLAELEEYVTYVNFVPAAASVPKYPVPKESNLNFLKPGSKEVVTRPIHINEHLPPMYPLLEEQSECPVDDNAIKMETTEDIDGPQFKKPSDHISPEFKRSKKDEESSRPTREISSVMMTTSGYLSPACEGKLPERKAPAPPVEPPKVQSPAAHVPDLVNLKKKTEKRKERPPKDFLKSIGDERPPKKSHSSKEPKIKAPKNHNSHPGSSVPLGSWNQQPHFPGEVRVPPLPPAPSHKPSSSKNSFNKTLAAAKAKTEKLNTTITPIPIKSEPPSIPLTPHQQVDKLITEPDKKKINILKKISNVKEKHEKPPKHHMSPHMMQQTRDIVNKINLSSDITIEPINPPVQRNTDYFFDDGSPPDTLSTPKTPEIMAYRPPLIIKERRKRKDKLDKPKAKKARKQPPPAHFLDTTKLDFPRNFDMEHNKTLPPDPSFIRQPLPPFMPNPPFRLPITNFGGPGLIPHPFSTSLFPFSAMMPNIHEPPILPPAPKSEPIPKVSPKNPEPIKQEPTEIVRSPRDQSPVRPTTPVVKVEEQPIEDTPKKSKEHKKDKKDKIKKKNKKEKVKDKSEKKKLKEAKKEKEKKKKKLLKEEPSMEAPSIPKILLKVNSPSPRPETPDAMKKLNIKPIVKKEETSPERKRETSPGLAKIAALVTGPPKPKNPSPILPAEKLPSESPSPTTPSRPPGRPRIHPLKSKPIPKVKKVQQPYTRQDAEGNTVWFCPECDLQDDGRPMIGCDGCDAWYHWVCVGIQVPPDHNENWYCRKCLAKKNADLSSKKKKRKKKNQP